MTELNTSPSLDDEELENKLIALAYKQSEQQLQEGTASSQIVTHFLKLGTRKAELELEQAKLQNKLLEEKIISEQSAAEINQMFIDVMNELKNYKSDPGEEFYAND